jgi:predicted RNA-binding Zn-ribbon protein involved in translation (DUF1610 family)
MTVTEWCPHCEVEVQLPKEFKPHSCPSCGEEILPCSLCETNDCVDCPLEKEKVFTLYFEISKAMTIDIKAKSFSEAVKKHSNMTLKELMELGDLSSTEIYLDTSYCLINGKSAETK